MVSAEESLKSILDETTLKARSPFGAFKILGINLGYDHRMDLSPEDLASVCFSEAPLFELPSFYKSVQGSRRKKNHYKKFGIAFETNFMRKKGGHPVFYYDRANELIRDSIEKLGDPCQQKVTKPILHLCEPYGPKIIPPGKKIIPPGEIDFRWEREWRVKGDLSFDLKDVAFGICPQEQIKEYEELIGHIFPFIDPDLPAGDLKKDLEQRGWKQLANHI